MKKTFHSLLEDLRVCLDNVELAEHYGDGKRATHNQIVLGSGDAQDATLQGIVVNWKGTACRSNTEFIARIDEATITGWRDHLSDAERLQGVQVGVEDLAPDTCLSFIYLFARLNGADTADFPPEWVDYANRWEQGDVKTTGKPLESWGCLLSALGHSYWQRAPAAGDAPAQLNTGQLKAGFVVCVRFTLGLLLNGCQPDQVVRSHAGSLDEYHQALALVDYERKVYLQALQHAERVQLLMPLRDSSRKVLVDVFIASDLALTGTIKSFIRNDAEHPWIGTGFPLMALHRPSERGTGNDITISADPSSRITLKALHQKIEARECACWKKNGKSRPADHPRPGYKWNEPWYLEPTNQSLIGAPHWLVKGEQYGSKLEWKDVVSALWRLYNPARNLPLEPEPLRRLPAQEKVGDSTRSSGPMEQPRKKLLADQRVRGEQSIVLSPTMKRYLMAKALRSGAQHAAIGIDDLPYERSFDFLALPGGFALIHREGTYLMDDSSRESFDVNSYVSEFEQADMRCRVLAEVGQALKDKSALLKKLAGQSSMIAHSSKDRISLEVLLAKRSLLMATMLETTPRAGDLHAAKFRELLEKRYGIASQLDQYYALLGELEARHRRDADALDHEQQELTRISADRTQAVVSGLAAFIVAMALWHEIEKLKWLNEFWSGWLTVLFPFVAALLASRLIYKLWKKATLVSHSKSHHTNDEEEAFATETAVHAAHAMHEPHKAQSEPPTHGRGAA